MSWTLKILADNFIERKILLNNGDFEKQSSITKDFVLNHHRDLLSTWREVEYELNKRKESINKQDLEDVLVLDSTSDSFQFINPLTEEVTVVLPKKPKEHTKYIIKNLNTSGRRILVKSDLAKEPIVILSNPDNVVKLYFDSVQYQLEI